MILLGERLVAFTILDMTMSPKHQFFQREKNQNAGKHSP
jgi:hypothetical protein